MNPEALDNRLIEILEDILAAEDITPNHRQAVRDAFEQANWSMDYESKEIINSDEVDKLHWLSVLEGLHEDVKIRMEIEPRLDSLDEILALEDLDSNKLADLSSGKLSEADHNIK